MITSSDFLKTLGLENQEIKNTGSGSDWDLERILDRFISINEPKTFKEASEIMMKYLSENHHPHTMAEIESNRAVLWEGKETHLNDSFIVD